MSRTALLGLLLACWTSIARPAAAGPVIAVMPGDTQTPAVAQAIARLQQDAAAADVVFRLLPDLAADDDALAGLVEADLVLVSLHARSLNAELARLAPRIRAQGGALRSLSPIVDATLAQAGVEVDAQLAAYHQQGGVANYVQLLRLAAVSVGGPAELGKDPAPPRVVPAAGYLDVVTGQTPTTFSDYRDGYLARRPDAEGRPWVGVLLLRSTVTSGQTRNLAAIQLALEQRGYNVLPAFGHPPGQHLEALFLDEQGASRIQVLVALALKLGVRPETVGPALVRLDVPVVNAIGLFSQSRADWEASPVGIGHGERSWQIGGPELAGAIAPTVVSAKALVTDPQTGLSWVSDEPIPERVQRLAARVDAWAGLRRTAPADKRVAVVTYNYPSGAENIGASYLDVLPGSLWTILSRLDTDGLDLGDDPPRTPDALFDAVLTAVHNPPAGDHAGLDALVRSGHAVLLPVERYQRWFAELPAALRAAVVDQWGQAADSDVMTWRDADGRPFLVLPVLRLGNVVLAAQPTRGWDDDPHAAEHDLTLPPHHQYLAFYLWLQRDFQAHAVVHVGTHATHEWMPGREVGLGPDDASDVLTGDIPQVYPYIVDDIGEGQQAKRRGLATIISHMTPPLARTGLSPELVRLGAALDDLRRAGDRGALDLDARRAQVGEAARAAGLLRDLGLSERPLDAGGIELLTEHLESIERRVSPLGLHTFGRAPSDADARLLAREILGADPDARGAEGADLLARIAASGPAELDALSAAVQGRHVAAGPGNDPRRQPDSLPTGRNFHGFDPSRMPTPASYAAGVALADQLLADWRAEHQDAWPERLAFTLFSTEANRHEGVIEGQILALLGVRPTWDDRGRVLGLELVPDAELGRPRVDVTLTPSGLYRDAFAPLLLLLDQAIGMAQDADQGGVLGRHSAQALQELLGRGVPREQAERMARVRIFGLPVGAYGAGLDRPMDGAGPRDEARIADVYLRRFGHLYGQGFWSSTSEDGAAVPPELGDVLVRSALRGADAVVHSRSGAVYASLDNDDFYQYLGGAALAVRVLDGRTPPMLVADLSQPGSNRTVSLQRFLGEELQARYLNPRWVEEMLDEGYAGAKFIRQVTDNLYGWQVAAPEAVGPERWQALYDVYVADRYQLDVQARFVQSGNAGAMRAMVETMQAAAANGYWSPDDAVTTRLGEAIARLDALDPAPGAAVAPASAPVTGRVLETVHGTAAATPGSPGLHALLGLGAVGLFGLGWWRRSRATPGQARPGP